VALTGPFLLPFGVVYKLSGSAEMTEASLIDYMYIILFLMVGFIGGFTPFIVNWFIRPKRTHLKKSLNTYECGMDTYGKAWDYRYGIAYYLYALIFLAFDVDILYLFPVAAYFDKVSGVRGVIEIFIFIGILTLAIVYAWAKGVFTWEKKRTVR
jgi:NADH:ubiquinone oxidoreductase subunit 3 (subunit A)